jgi:hypothetical protein
MAKTKTAEPDTRTQRQKFIDKARELETDNSKETFERTLKAIATAPTPKTTTPSPKR